MCSPDWYGYDSDSDNLDDAELKDGDRVGVRLDLDAGTMIFFRNGNRVSALVNNSCFTCVWKEGSGRI